MVWKWLRPKARTESRSRRYPTRNLAPVADIVEQGLLVADVAVRMTVKNHIIMNALKRRLDFDDGQIREMVRTALIELAEEREKDARHIDRMRREIRKTGRSSWSESEYGDNDNRTLRHRQQVYEGVAEELRLRAADEDVITETVQRARDAAWHEIGDSLSERATHPYYSGGSSPEYQAARDERIQQLIIHDLTALMRDQEKSSSLASKKRLFGKKLDSGPSVRPGED